MKVISHISLLFDIKHMLFFFFFFFLRQRGQLSNLDKLGQIAKVNTLRGLILLLSLPFSFPSFETLFGFRKSLTWIFCDGDGETHIKKKDPNGTIRGQGGMLLLDSPEVHEP